MQPDTNERAEARHDTPAPRRNAQMTLGERAFAARHAAEQATAEYVRRGYHRFADLHARAAFRTRGVGADASFGGRDPERSE
jgi:hypothetical protein